MKFILFDIDGTLADTKKVDDKCFVKAFHQTFNIDISAQRWENLKNVTDWGITEEIFFLKKKRKPTRDEFESMTSNFTNLLNLELARDASQFKEVPGAKSFFQILKQEQDLKLGIATGGWGRSARLKLDTIGIDLKDIGFSNSDYYKSREEITKDVISQLGRVTGVRTNDIIYFGDGQWDYQTCKNLGIKFIGIDVREDGRLETLGAKTVFPNFLQVNDLLSAIS